MENAVNSGHNFIFTQGYSCMNDILSPFYSLEKPATLLSANMIVAR